MGPRAPLTLALGFALALCGCDNASARNEPTSDLGAMFNHDLGMSNDSSVCTTAINITVTPSPAPGGFAYAPADLVAIATPNGGNGTPVWDVTVGGAGDFKPDIVDQQSMLTVRFHAATADSYEFKVHFVGGGDACYGSASVVVHDRGSQRANYRLRVSPPESYNVPEQDQVVTVFDNDSDTNDLVLLDGTPILGTLAGPSGPIGGEVRLIADSGPDAVALAPATGGFQLAVKADALYTPLLIPAGNTLAPRLLGKASGADAALADFTVGAGQAVTGTVRDPPGAAVSGARLVLRAGALPSGAAISASDGTFALRAESASGYTLLVGAPGWPELALPGVAVAGATTVDVQYQLPRVTVSAKVLASDGKTAIGGARVTVRSPSLAGAATVSLAGGAAQPALGRVNQVLLSAGDGTLPSLLLPAGTTYTLLIEPPAGAADGVTALTFPLAGADSWTLTLQPRITLAGRVVDALGQPVPGAQVTAFETAGLGAAPSTVSDAAGKYSLVVDPGAPLQLQVDPAFGQKLAGTRTPLAAGTTQAADVTLAAGVLVGGFVRYKGAALPSVVVEALCYSCASPTPLASAISDGNGHYRVYLPNPGLAILDGGTD